MGCRASTRAVPPFFCVSERFLTSMSQHTACAQLWAISAVDPGGSLPKWLVSYAAKRSPVRWVDRIREACRLYRAGKRAHSVKTFGR